MAAINSLFLDTFTQSVIGVINGVLVPVLFAVAFFYFILGVYRYFILGAESAEERKKGRQFVLWGVIGFAVILSVWGLVQVVQSIFLIPSGGTPPTYPQL